MEIEFKIKRIESTSEKRFAVSVEYRDISVADDEWKQSNFSFLKNDLKGDVFLDKIKESLKKELVKREEINPDDYLEKIFYHKV